MTTVIVPKANTARLINTIYCLRFQGFCLAGQHMHLPKSSSATYANRQMPLRDDDQQYDKHNQTGDHGHYDQNATYECDGVNVWMLQKVA
eukprot:CAMPEP_0178416462 /NCGR_PEP_ID=MMETSP0689_2-20121128/24076_1 /TAXON_ID=160604 /ORGANISM="Amphidinium massartii, Strain CS-259" /LENGTH=89 /DNA_ID=CAMNT_0020037807 /DNA_START=130 /DNA_END=399 /DNA_ORIENTATION=-